jgi:hypothetical protein
LLSDSIPIATNEDFSASKAVTSQVDTYIVTQPILNVNTEKETGNKQLLTGKNTLRERQTSNDAAMSLAPTPSTVESTSTTSDSLKCDERLDRPQQQPLSKPNGENDSKKTLLRRPMIKPKPKIRYSMIRRTLKR